MLETQKSFSNMVSHELKTPLARMRFTTEILQSSDNQDSIASLNREISEMDDLIQQLLLRARLESSAAVFTTVSLEACLNKACTKARALSEHLNIRLDIHHQLNTQMAGDATLLQILFSNIIHNAIEHAKSRVRVHAVTDKHRWQIIIEDDGEGIDSHIQDSLFKAFSHLASAHSKSLAQVGLGLHIAKQIADYHHLSINYQTSELGGAKFTIIPIADSA